MERQGKLLHIYQLLHRFFGPQHWWPGDTPFEVMVGAILTQNTNWLNVEKAIANLKKSKVLSAAGILRLSYNDLADIIRPSGYFNIKAERLKSYVAWYKTACGAKISSMRAMSMDKLRHELLKVRGVGEETADCIMLYAAEMPSFVIDAYTRRIFSRLGYCSPDVKYGQLRSGFMQELPCEAKLYNEYHALIVALGKDYCSPKPRCGKCPLKNICQQKIS
ncbi:MAG: hypothetical protein ACYTFY_03470 [Planctomycetota bacterium]|jgi:endonuclease-3 related protein